MKQVQAVELAHSYSRHLLVIKALGRVSPRHKREEKHTLPFDSVVAGSLAEKHVGGKYLCKPSLEVPFATGVQFPISYTWNPWTRNRY